MPTFAPEQLLPFLTSFPGARSAWVAYSGGLDSEVLLHSVASLRDRLPYEVGAVHLDHGLQPSSPRWAEQCRARCEGLGVPLRLLRVSAAAGPGESPEAAAREARYRALAGLLAPGDLLLTGHHRDDQAETFLLALMRGSGLKGLAAMPRVADLGAGRLLRPLLGLAREDLRDYAERVGLEWIEDPSNLEPAFDRNYLRHRVLPLLAGRWPACSTMIARSAEHCAEAQGLIEEVTEKALVRLAGTRAGTLSVSGLRALDAALGRALLRQWTMRLDLPPPGLSRVNRILTEVLNAGPDAQPLVTWAGCEVRRYRDDLFAMTPLPPRPPSGPRTWRAGVLELPFGLGRLELRDDSGRRLDPEHLRHDRLQVGFGMPGLTCRPAAGGHRRRLKKLFQEAGVPSWLRPYVPLLFNRYGLVAVGDLWMCEDAPARCGLEIRWAGGIRSHPGFPASRR